MQQAVVFAGQRVQVAMSEKANIALGFQIVEVLRERSELPVEEFDGAGVLHAAVDGHLLTRALGFECNARHLHVQADRNAGGQHKDQQQRESGFLLSSAISHPANSATSGSVC